MHAILVCFLLTIQVLCFILIVEVDYVLNAFIQQMSDDIPYLRDQCY